MILQNWWYTTLLGTKYPLCPPLRGDHTADVVIVGGGMAGLSAALRLMTSGRRVILLERNILGGSSTGKSAGFLTPDSELELAQLARRFGPDGARDLWDAAVSGIGLIRSSIETHGLGCDFAAQDSLFLGIGRGGWQAVEEEVETRRLVGYETTLYHEAELPKVIGGGGYRGGVRYPGTYGFNPLRWAQELKPVLFDHGVGVYESTEVTHVDGHTVRTHLGSVTADEIIFCSDKVQPRVSSFARNIYHAQTFMSVSEPLEDEDIARLFPAGPMQCWDSSLVYSYFRLTGDGRLLLGGGSAISTFAMQAWTSSRVIGGVIRDFKRRFPFLDHLQFIQYWPGLIDTTRDLLPTIIRDKEAPWVHYVLGCVGLPWASFCGDYVANHVLDHDASSESRYYRYLTTNRGFALSLAMQKIVGKPILFSLNNFWAKYYQVDRHRTVEKREDNF
jgi:gamma-glutamylputrescine oxidase